jgi:hypothetical protein
MLFSAVHRLFIAVAKALAKRCLAFLAAKE